MHATIDAVKQLCRRYGIAPSRQRSQNFLIDPGALRDMVASARLRRGETVIEVGSGFGILTHALAEAGARVVAIEVDERLARATRDRCRGDRGVQVITTDFLRWYRRDRQQLVPGAFSIAANLPYHMSAFFFRTVLGSAALPRQITAMLQWEVAQRISASPGDMSLLALAVQLSGRPVIVRPVPRSSFWPIPAVDSAIITVTNIHQPSDDNAAIFQLARICFSNRRKQVHNALAGGLHVPDAEIQGLLSRSRIDAGRRPQELSLDDWRRIAQAWRQAQEPKNPNQRR